MSTNMEKIDEVFLLCSSLDTPGTFIPSHISIFINRIEKLALWESVYVHESIHSLLTDTLTGWWIQLLEDIGNNMFVALRRGDILSESLVSWILNLEFKRRKLMESWMQTQEGFATYFQLDVVDVEKRSVNITAELCRLRHEDFTEEKASQTKSEVAEIKRKWQERITSRDCPEHYWKGYEIVKEIARKFGKENLAPVSLAACSVNFPKSMVAQGVDSFQEMISQEKYNVDKRLELISKIPAEIVQSFPLNDNWMGLLQSILKYFGEKELEEFEFGGMVKEGYTNQAFPKEFTEIIRIDLNKSFDEAKKRWEKFENKGITASQLVTLFNVSGEGAMISNFERVDSPEADQVLLLIYRSILNGLDKVALINDLLKRLNAKRKLEGWMEMLWGFGDLERFRDMFPFQKLVCLDELCLICHKPSLYSNPVLSCNYSGIRICFNCCVEMKCSNCEKFRIKQKILLAIEQMLDTFTYKL